MKLFKKKLNVKLLIAFILTLGTLYFLYDIAVPKDKLNVQYQQYVKAKVKIEEGTQITDEMLDYDSIPAGKVPAGTVATKEDIIGKFADTQILKDEPINIARVKTEIISEYGSDEREVRIFTDIQAYGGVGPGDRADLIFTADILSEKIGILKYEGVLVKKVLNEDGEDIEKVTADKYTEKRNKPYLVVITTNQEAALHIETLQSVGKEVRFKLIKWTERSEKQNKDNTKLRYNELINNTNTYNGI